MDAVESGGVGIAQLFKHFRRHGKIMKRMEQWDIHFTWFLYVFILFIQVHMCVYKFMNNYMNYNYIYVCNLDGLLCIYSLHGLYIG